MKGGHLQVHHSLITSTKKARLAHEFRAEAAACMGIWLEASLYASDQLTDGKVPVPVLYSMVDPELAKRLIDILVEVELFAKISDYEVEIVGYLDRNRSREQVEALSEKRKNAGSLGGARSKPKAKPKQTESKKKAKAKPPVSVSVSVSESVSVANDLGESEGDPVEAVHRHWVGVFGRPRTKLTPERRRKVQARLRDGYTPDDLCKAVDGCAKSQFHVDGGYTTLGTILKSAETVDQHIERARRGAVRGLAPPASASDFDAMDDTAAQKALGM